MYKKYYDSFDCEVTPEELEGFEDWCKELDEYEYPLINEEDIPF